jgi:hypothetical protein
MPKFILMKISNSLYSILLTVGSLFAFNFTAKSQIIDTGKIHPSK